MLLQAIAAYDPPIVDGGSVMDHTHPGELRREVWAAERARAGVEDAVRRYARGGNYQLLSGSVPDPAPGRMVQGLRLLHLPDGFPYAVDTRWGRLHFVAGSPDLDEAAARCAVTDLSLGWADRGAESPTGVRRVQGVELLEARRAGHFTWQHRLAAEWLRLRDQVLDTDPNQDPDLDTTFWGVRRLSTIVQRELWLELDLPVLSFIPRTEQGVMVVFDQFGLPDALVTPAGTLLVAGGVTEGATGWNDAELYSGAAYDAQRLYDVSPSHRNVGNGKGGFMSAHDLLSVRAANGQRIWLPPVRMAEPDRGGRFTSALMLGKYLSAKMQPVEPALHSSTPTGASHSRSASPRSSTAVR